MVAAGTSPVLRRGDARLRVEWVAGASAITHALATNPVKLLTPRPRALSAWACVSSFGGGLVAGDQTSLDLEVGPQARCHFGTQASTKVYRNPDGKPCGHHSSVRLGEEALLVFAPDPVQAFAGSSYSQRQQFAVEESSGLVLLDWFTAGRSARGERWVFQRLSSRNEVSVAGRPVLVDALVLDSTETGLGSAHQLGRFNCVASLLIIGPQLDFLAVRLKEEIGARPVTRRASLLTSLSPVAGGVLVRLIGTGTEAVTGELRRWLAELTPLLGDDPWARKW